MGNVWNITEDEYREARKRSRDPQRSDAEREDAYQLCRFYRGEIFNRDPAARAAQSIRLGAKS